MESSQLLVSLLGLFINIAITIICIYIYATRFQPPQDGEAAQPQEDIVENVPVNQQDLTPTIDLIRNGLYMHVVRLEETMEAVVRIDGRIRQVETSIVSTNEELQRQDEELQRQGEEAELHLNEWRRQNAERAQRRRQREARQAQDRLDEFGSPPPRYEN